MTQFGRALSELNIEILCANSSQAKGRVERMHRTLQDRLVKELRLAGIRDMETGNAFLPGFMEHYNARFAIVPARCDDLHRPINLAPLVRLTRPLPSLPLQPGPAGSVGGWPQCKWRCRVSHF